MDNKHKKICLTLFVNREMQIKTSMLYHFKSTRDAEMLSTE